MKVPGRNFLAVVGLLLMMGLVGCKQENPAEQTKVPSESSNAVTEAVRQAAVEAVKGPLDKARQTEGGAGEVGRADSG